FGEGRVDEPHAGMQPDLVAVRGCDPGALLTPVLKGVEAEEGQSRHILAGCVDPEHPTRFARRIKWHCGRPSCDPVPGLARGPSVARGTLDPAGALRERPAPGLRNLGERERKVPLDLEPVAACRTEPLE